MIKKVNLDGVKAYGSSPMLPKGGYVCKVMGVEVKENKVGQYLEVSCDIAEGEYKNHFADDYKSQTGEDKVWHCNCFVNVPNDDGSEKDMWAKRKFKTFMDALEDSNTGYTFDYNEKKMKGLMVGGLFNTRQYFKKDGSIGESTSLASFTSVTNIRSGKYRLPKDKILEESTKPKMEIISTAKEEDADDELPF